ncbi:MAG: hypothetical protein H6702_14375 [Myxococcales bacterium]|nr:hypothetical protein [Myxococcales bacterium]
MSQAREYLVSRFCDVVASYPLEVQVGAEGIAVQVVGGPPGRAYARFRPCGGGWVLVFPSGGERQGTLDSLADHLERSLRACGWETEPQAPCLQASVR